MHIPERLSERQRSLFEQLRAASSKQRASSKVPDHGGLQRGELNLSAQSVQLKDRRIMAELAHPGPNFAGEHKPLSETISIHNLDFFYGKSQALKNINLTLYPPNV